MSSAFKRFYTLSPHERLRKVRDFAGLEEEEVLALLPSRGLSMEQADHMIENVIGTMELPVGVAVYFKINGKDYTVPMALEEPSVVAAASKMAKIARNKGGFCTSSTESIMIGQIQIVDVVDPFAAKMRILAQKAQILEIANQQAPNLVKAGGGARDLEIKVLDSNSGPMIICHLLVDCKDAMGANAVNTMAEAVAYQFEKISGGNVYLRIISNLSVYRLARASAVFDQKAVGGEMVIDRMVAAYHFANVDPFRATTHNKGIMNGITGVALATGQDTRALEAGAHAYAALRGGYRSMTTWEKNQDGDLVGTLELPMAVGIIGGITNVHPVVQANLNILGVKSARELAEVMVAVGLAQNAAALRALADEGIQKGHMALHAKNLAVMAGAPAEMIEQVVCQMITAGKVRLDYAQQVVEQLLVTKIPQKQLASCMAVSKS